ncbi:MAG: hypothetical protein PQJ58_16100 [Spirochaetales bacterium]|nr:hypothetical protein [Spirochaetales bacterium]
MKKLLVVFVVVCMAFLSMGCDETVSSDPQMRIYVDSTLGSTNGTVYGALGTYNADNNSFSTESSWVSADGGEFSSYTTFTAGSYTVLRDYDSDHGTATVWTTFSYDFEDKNKYTIYFDATGGFTISIDE